MPRKSRKNSGFNLIEAAIVLGVIGLVIGGIWVAAASVSERFRLNRATGELILITQAIQKVFPSHTYPSTDGDWLDITLAAARSGAVPSTWVRTLNDVGTYGQIFHPWSGTGQSVSNGYAAIWLGGPNNGYTTRPAMQIELGNLKRSACLALVHGLVGRRGPNSIVAITTNSTSIFNESTLNNPISLSFIDTNACTNGDDNMLLILVYPSA